MSVEMIVRTEGMANSYGLGEEVIPGVTLFRAGADFKNYNLTYDDLQAAIKRQKRATIKESK